MEKQNNTMEGVSGEPFPHSHVTSAEDKKTYKHGLRKKNPQADLSREGDQAIITILLLYTEDCSILGAGLSVHITNISSVMVDKFI